MLYGDLCSTAKPLYSEQRYNGICDTTNYFRIPSATSTSFHVTRYNGILDITNLLRALEDFVILRFYCICHKKGDPDVGISRSV